MNLRSLLAISLAGVACNDPLPIDTTAPGTNPIINPTNPNDPDPTIPDPTEPEPAFSLSEGWYEAEVELDINIDVPVINNTTLNTTCEGIAVFEYRDQRISVGYWECRLPGESGFDFGTVTGLFTGWQGTALRAAWGDFEPYVECTGLLDDGECHLKGEIEGLFNDDTGQMQGDVTIVSSGNDPVSGLPPFVNGLIDTLVGDNLSSIDRPLEQYIAGYIDDRTVRFTVTDEDEDRVTAFEFDIDADWVGTSPPPYDVFSLLP